MKNDRPILFSTAMVQAILAGRKTQTRRVVKMAADECYDTVTPTGIDRVPHTPNTIKRDFRCPYGVPGDVLWVRETWCKYGGGFIYRADYGNFTPISDGIGGPWKPSIHMPREAARIFLTVKDVSVERLQEISEVDAKAEGVCPDDVGRVPIPNTRTTRALTYREAFSFLWDSINGKRGHPWQSSPYVWVVTFERTDHAT